MFKNKILKKLGAGLMAGLCAFSMLGTNFNSSFGASAVSSSTENVAFPSADTVIAKAATLLGTPYTFGNKGYSGIYTQGACAAVRQHDQQSWYRLFRTCVLHADPAGVQYIGIFVEQSRSCGHSTLADGQ